MCMPQIVCLLLMPMSEEAPEFKLIRYEEDWSGQKSRSLKYMPLGNSGSYLTVGGETRQRYELFRNPVWGLEPSDGSGYLLQRYMIHADAHLGSRFRMFGQLKSGIETGRAGGPRPPDRDELDVHQAFIELKATGAVQLRAGRQEISLGSSRLVGIREGPNVRQSFDGFRFTAEMEAWKVELLALRPVETNRGMFDDSPGHRQSFWGAYATAPRRRWGSTDVYYLGLDRKSHGFDQGMAREQRHSVGARWYDKRDGWDFDQEGVWQFGRFGPSPIRAWTASSNSGYTFGQVPLRPRIGMKADIASGDKSPLDRRLGTFNALFPKGAYFSEADLLGPYNIMDLHPSFTMQIGRSASITADADYFWRQSKRDGIYDMPGNLIVSGRDSRSRHIGAHAGVIVEWDACRYLRFTANYLRFSPGAFLRDVGLGRTVNFVGLWATFRF